MLRPCLAGLALSGLTVLASPSHAASIQAPIGQGPAEDGSTQALGATPCVGGFAGIYPCSNVDLMAFLPNSTIGGGSGSNLWGWVDPVTGHEWVIYGRSNGTAFVDITDPANPVYTANLLTHTVSSSWREVKAYGNHAYIVADNAGAHGIQIFDLTRLRSITSPPVTFTAAQADGHYSAQGLGRCHTVTVDEQSGFLYCNGTDTFNGGLHIVDLSNPENPTFAGSFGAEGYIHDSQCVVYQGPDVAHQGKQICFNANSTTSGGPGTDKLTIVDVTNKSAPVKLSSPTYAGSGFIHQGWLTEDHRYFLVDDELDEDNFGHNTKTYMWDLLDLDAPALMGFHMGPTAAIDHNQYIKGNYSYQANYAAGLRILDLTNLPSASLSEVALFDVVPANNNPAFTGAWGVYPFFPSGNVVVSSISSTSGGLFVLRPTLQAAFTLQATPGTIGVCGTGNAGTTVNVTPTNGYTGTVTFGTTGLPGGASAAFVPTSTAVPGSTTLTITANGVPPGSYPFTVTATDGTITRQTSATLSVSTSTPPAPLLATPANGASNQPLRPSFTWAAAAGATSYDVQIATTPVFQPADIVQSATAVPTTTWTATSDLQTNTTYYWRVRTTSACGTGPWSNPRSFTTTAPAAGCPLGTTAQAAFSESFETGAVNWNHNGTGDTWAASMVRVHDGAFSFHAADPATVSDQRMTSPPILLPPASQAPVTLQFWNWQGIESELTETPDTVGCRDGAIVEISTDGANWTRLEAQLLTDPYDGLVSGGTGNPLAGVAAWCGNPQDWLSSVADVTAWGGQSVRFRFRLASDNANAREGWYLDELKVQGCLANPTPSLTIDDVTAEEADAHNGTDHSPLLTFAVTLSAPSGQAVTVNWATADGTATAGLDYTPASGTLTFAPGSTVQPIDVTMLPDSIPEPPETFFVNLTGAVAATLSDPQGVATILDNDAVPTLSIADATVVEGDSGTRQLVFTVTQSQAIAQTTGVGFFSEDASAVAPSDYTAATGTLTFPAGVTSRSVTVLVNGDPVNELDEEMHVHLISPIGATLADDHAIGAIVDDDDGPGQELVHGSSEVRSLASLPGGVPNASLFRIAQRAGASYEVRVDAASGDVSPPVLERLGTDQSTVLQTGVATGTGGSVALRWENRGPAQLGQWIRVRSGGCQTDCGADDTYRVRAYETSLALARFVANGSQVTIATLQNPGTRTLSGNVDFWSPTGTLLGTRAFSLGPRVSLTFDVSTVAGVAGQSGTATITHDGGYGDLVGKAVALEPATGFAFDTPFVVRAR